MNETWVDVFAARFGRPFDDDRHIETWEGEIRIEIPDLRDGELTNAVRNLSNKRASMERPPRFPPTAQDLIAQIRDSRARVVNGELYRSTRIISAPGLPDKECPDYQEGCHLECALMASPGFICRPASVRN